MGEVELVDEDAPGPGAPADAALARRSRVLRLLRRWWPVPVVLVAVLAGWQLVAGARERDEVERLRRTPGVLAATVTAPLEAEPWGGPEASLVLAGGVRTADGLVVGSAHTDPDGAGSVLALDAATGAEAWRVAVADPLPPGAAGGMDCRPDAEPATVLWCTVRRFADGRSAPAGGARARLVAVDLDRGVVREERDLPAGTSVVPVAGGLIEVGSGPAGITVRGDGWATELPDPVPGGEFPAATVADGHLWVWGATAIWSLDPADGRVEASSPDLDVVRGGRLAQREGPTRTRLLGADGRGSVVVDGQPAIVRVDDGREPDLVLLHAAEDDGTGLLRAVRADDGALAWERRVDLPLGGGLLVLGGLVHGGGGAGVWALDLATGAERWSGRGAPPAGWDLVTDGVHVLRAERDPATGEEVLAGYDRRDGGRWAAALPEDVTTPEARGALLLAQRADGRTVVLD
jgi:outer membrane protein assembly factor BamB